MASPSPWSWSRKAINSHHSTIFCFPLYHCRTRLTTFTSFDSSSSSSSSSCSSSFWSCTPTPNSTKRLKQSVNLVRSPDKALPLLRDQDFSSSKSIALEVNSENVVSSSPIRSRYKRKLSFKSLFGRRSLWRRIFFASRKVRSIILLNVLTIIYASNIPVVKEVEAITDPALFTVVRFAVSAIPFIPFVFQARGDARTRNAGIELGLWVSLGYLMQALGLLTSDAGRASFISALTVIVVPFLDGLLGATVSSRTWLGAFMSILGVAMLESSGSPPSVGDLLNFFSAVFFGVHMLRTEHISRSTNKENFLPLIGYEVSVIALLSTVWYVIGGCFGTTQVCIPSTWTWTMFWNWMCTFPWIPVLYTGIFSTGLCLWIEDVSATETAIIYGMEPVWGAGFAWFLLGERWGTAGWIGAPLVIVGSLMVQIFGSSTPTKSRKDEESSQKGDYPSVSDKKNDLSTSNVHVSPRKDVLDIPDEL
ncbi:uncharacterized protein LOC131153566 isoform X2 [Malania oleifera]|uniref:uncharacterized protein LOC131153566 isoform X2 n=1 Tax=Malania oleifera TaxID=397392 RepID=UPI0025ADD7B1|nr:uncharacterized protein LOC131153566 isoform X2 [Malania oleifera]